MKKIILIICGLVVTVFAALIIRDIYIIKTRPKGECCSCCSGKEEVCIDMCCPCTHTLILPDDIEHYF